MHISLASDLNQGELGVQLKDAHLDLVDRWKRVESHDGERLNHAFRHVAVTFVVALSEAATASQQVTDEVTRCHKEKRNGISTSTVNEV